MRVSRPEHVKFYGKRPRSGDFVFWSDPLSEKEAIDADLETEHRGWCSYPSAL